MAQPAISCRNVWKVFGPDPAAHVAALSAGGSGAAGHVVAVRDVTLDVTRGEMLVVMGLSGSGKSTLVRCLSRLIETTAGAIDIDGVEIGSLTEASLIALRREKMGMVFQSFGLLPHRTVLQNVAFPLEMRGMDRMARTARAREVLELVGLRSREDYFPRELSGGQQQRVGIARSLAIEPDIWFLDEPFSALDPLIRREMQDEFLRLKKQMDRTIVFITHDFDEALRLADRIAIMKDGAIVQCDSPDRIVLAPASDYVAKFTAGVDRSRVVHVGTFAMPLPPDAPPEGSPLPAGATLREIARSLVADPRPTIPVADTSGRLVGALDRNAALDLVLEARPA
ncbi:MAG: betaine/proline/choline family ABC transporter ATP-binding protein [Rubellimicrobium sp.]|nr:betaine/proline/choline family ABC transporter ATP-binding protein [Rubellimicrobium sp.]